MIANAIRPVTIAGKITNQIATYEIVVLAASFRARSSMGTILRHGKAPLRRGSEEYRYGDSNCDSEGSRACDLALLRRSEPLQDRSRPLEPGSDFRATFARVAR